MESKSKQLKKGKKASSVNDNEHSNSEFAEKMQRGYLSKKNLCLESESPDI